MLNFNMTIDQNLQNSLSLIILDGRVDAHGGCQEAELMRWVHRVVERRSDDSAGREGRCVAL
jgi:hypothetical protein